MSLKKFFNVSAVLALMLALTPALSGCLEDVMPLEIGAKAPPAEITLLSGETRQITDHPGKGQGITFMSSWCPCSNESIPMMKKAYDMHGQGDDGKIAFLMMGIQDPESKFRDFVAKWEMPFPAAYDDGDDIGRLYGVKQPPTTVFIDKEGIVQRVFYGNIKDREEDFYLWIEGLL